MDHLWSEIDEAVMKCLDAGMGVPVEIGERLGMSEAAAVSILS